ncbi:hypothetical protein J7T55_008337 [Diaporthe amygdali]|uniref:uncharacterized protein n=1 Tax=Phomopsis amygdali TaxID=1214568 RepID=UPI0022FE0654|nr:uncharacterized protein J7T55_008337 [Diaporthe amygdali]KAJ0121175.1 hypothetical protein J7T55_008337 [Diaporthe amygdali]
MPTSTSTIHKSDDSQRLLESLASPKCARISRVDQQPQNKLIDLAPNRHLPFKVGLTQVLELIVVLESYHWLEISQDYDGSQGVARRRSPPGRIEPERPTTWRLDTRAQKPHNYYIH